MVQYQMKKVISKSGSSKNVYTKVYKNGDKVNITKTEYLQKQKGGQPNLSNLSNLSNKYSSRGTRNTNRLASNLYLSLEKEITNQKNSILNDSDLTLFNWFNSNKEIIRQLVSRFDYNGKLVGDNLSATTFNDFYKWSMLPVIRYLETCPKFENKPIHVTFSVNIREEHLRKELLTNEILQNNVKSALNNLKNRKFNINLFNEILAFKGLTNKISLETIELICGTPGNEKSLIDEVVYEKYVPSETDSNDVVISFFEENDSKLKGRRMYIEATGPWHRVTWLETTMMQCVYEELLRNKLKNEGKTYALWMIEALKRCSKSVNAIKALETERTNKPNSMGYNTPLKGALFTGRRTGGYAFLLLQNLFVKDNYTNCIGTSSVDAWYDIKQVAPARVLMPVGTHAHELSMVISTLMSDIDDKTNYPLTQLIGHYLYFLTSIPNGNIKNKVNMPMLPDTLGTEAFVRIASMINVNVKNGNTNEQSRFLDIIGSARQDSGTLENFVAILDKYDFKGGMMASEIDNIDSLIEASSILRNNNTKYAFGTFGAGGFFGDSEAAWNPSVKNISMAVKAARVYVNYQPTRVKPIKLGDSNSTSKLEVNGLLEKGNSKAAIDRALSFKVYSKRNAKNNENKIAGSLQFTFDNALREIGVL